MSRRQEQRKFLSIYDVSFCLWHDTVSLPEFGPEGYGWPWDTSGVPVCVGLGKHLSRNCSWRPSLGVYFTTLALFTTSHSVKVQVPTMTSSTGPPSVSSLRRGCTSITSARGSDTLYAGGVSVTEKVITNTSTLVGVPPQSEIPKYLSLEHSPPSILLLN